MSCTRWETGVALYAGSDLPAADAAPAEAHLAGCAACRALLDELRAEQSLLADLRDEPLADAMVARVRHNVLARVSVPRRAPWGWRLAFAAAVVLAVVLAWPRHRPAKPVHVAAAQPERAIPAPAIPAPVAPVRVVPARHHAVRRHLPAPAIERSEPLLVQFVTNNPDIVIYWLVDQKPQGD